MIDMAEPDINAFCAHLKAEREERGISLEAISGRTRINIRFLEAIERADFDVLQPVYIRIFVRNYIRSIDLDEAALMHEFDELRGERAAAVPEAAAPDDASGEADAGSGDADETREPVSFNADTVRKAVPFAVGAVLIAVLGYFLVGRMDNASRTPVHETPVTVPERTVPVPAAPPAPPAPDPRLSITLDALHYVWVLVAADGRDTLHSGFLQAGSSSPFSADSVLFIKIGLNESSGNAVGIALNGTDLGEWGAPRTRLTKMIVTRNGIDPDDVVSRAIPQQPETSGTAAAPAAAEPHAAPSDSAGRD